MAEFTFAGPFFATREAAAYLCKSIKGYYDWRRRHFIAVRADGTVAKADLDRAKKARRQKTRRGTNPASQANLQRRHKQQSTEPSSSPGSPFIRQERV